MTTPLLTPDGRPTAVVHLVAELAPYARTGGLGEAVSSLAAYQAASGLSTSVIIPLYRQARARLPKLVPVGGPYEVVVGVRREGAQLYTTPDDGPPEGTPDRRRRRRARHYFIENEYYFDRGGIYGEHGGDYGDNGRRFAFLAAAALAALPRIADVPLILHAHDWHAALAPLYLRAWYGSHPFYRQVSSVLSVHNAGFQGHFAPDALPDLGLPWELFDWHTLEWYGKANILKGGLALADAVATVSPNHATELRTAAGGFGLHDHFASLDRFVGIVNGIDQQIWNPEDDPHLAAPYGPGALAGKQACRRALQRAYDLPERDDVPIFAMAARLVWQKGLDLILAETGLFGLPAQFIFLGAGEARYEHALRSWAGRAPDRVRVDTSFNDPAEHRLMAGADVCLMPCQYEPCGLTQMRAQRYGTLPLVRSVGGLADTVEDGVTGFVFDAYDARAFVATVVRAIRTFHHRPTWEAMAREAMRRDFGWERSEERYLEVYRAVLGAGAA